MNTLLIIHTLSSLAMATVLVLVQVLVYPQFLTVPSSQLTNYAASHAHLISIIIIPLFFLELLTLLPLWFSSQTRSGWLTILTALFVLMWAYTFLKLVPLHNLIQSTADHSHVYTLITANWLRTAITLLKFLISFFFLYILFKPHFSHSMLHSRKIDDPFKKPNGVSSSLPRHSSHFINPLLNTHISQEQWTAIKSKVIKAFPLSEVIQDSPRELRLVVRTPLFKFPDLLILQRNDNAVHVRSESLIGYSDLNTNRKRVSTLI